MPLGRDGSSYNQRRTNRLSVSEILEQCPPGELHRKGILTDVLSGRLFLGNACAALSVGFLKKERFTHVITVMDLHGKEYTWEPEFRKRHYAKRGWCEWKLISKKDHETTDFGKIFPTTSKWIEDA